MSLGSSTNLPTATRAPAAFVYETEKEFLTTGDFDGDGKLDFAIVDKATGRVRLGYRVSDDYFSMPDWRAGGVSRLSGIAVGRLMDAKHDSLALVAMDATQISLFDASSRSVPTDPVDIPGTALGPSAVAIVDVGGAGNVPRPDLYVASNLNPEPTPNRVTLFRNAGKTFTQISETPVPGSEARANRLALTTGGPEFVVTISSGEKGDRLQAQKLESGKLEEVLRVGDLPAGVDYVAGNFRGTALKDFIFYTSGESELRVSSVEEAGAGKFKAAAFRTLSLPRPIKQLVTVDGEKKSRLLAIFGTNEPAELLDFDAVHAPVLVQQLWGATNKCLSAAVAFSNAVVLVSWEYSSVATVSREVSAYRTYALTGGSFVSGALGSLASLADRDDSTVPMIAERIVASSKEKSATDMKAYTNFIPGSEVSYQMVPIPGGEFMMGSPAGEKDHKPDEGPQHPVKVSPFWMSPYEVTWEEYLLFQYVDDEQNLRAAHPTDVAVNQVSDAVTRPSRPYPDMSFGMGKKKGLPAISMTQHAASKYCHWLSAKTGHFYRLPTEAEWEYACRAGTTTAYYFGDDPEWIEPGVFPAVVRELSGTVEYQKAGAGGWLPVKVEQTFQAGDKLRTANSSLALVKFADLAEPSHVTENTTIVIPKPYYLGRYAWDYNNSDSKYQKVGMKKPNPWGLYDMHGNVSEWVLDQYDPDYYKTLTAAGIAMDPWNRATKPYPHSVRGGSWDDDAATLRSAARGQSDRGWKATYPQLPKSIWHLSDWTKTGFRLVRPLAVPAPEEMVKYWTSGVEKD